MTYKVFINDGNYSSWVICGADTMLEIDLSLNPLDKKIFTGDTIDTEYNIITSPIREDNNLPGIILLVGKTYGRAKHGIGRFYYKCIPNDKRLPSFLIPYEQKILGFNKNITNKYILFKYNDWEGKHPTGVITNTIGDIAGLSNFYEYQLYCKNLFKSIKPFTKALQNACKQSVEEPFITSIIDKYPAIEDRLDYDIISIDPEFSTDLDDAMGLKDNILSIYIANVPLLMEHFNLWNSFSERISTIYLPDRKCPMLPTMMSENLCSLLENEARFAFCIDITIEDDKIKEVYCKNVVIKVKKNYQYECSTLNTDQMYLNIVSRLKLLNKNYAYIKEIQDSHDVVAYLMILMNNKCADMMDKLEIGIYRTLSLKKTPKINNNSLSNEVLSFIKIWQSSSGQYSNHSNKTGHDLIGKGITNYIHITSPIRRLVDLLNIMNLQHKLNLIPLSESAQSFYNVWENRLEYINTTMRSIRKVQIDCNILNLCVSNPDVLNKIYDGHVFDKMERPNKILQYTVYIPDIKIIARVNIKEDFEEYSCHKFKLYLIEDGTTLKRKIRATMV
jgi:exoribonuclease R